MGRKYSVKSMFSAFVLKINVSYVILSMHQIGVVSTQGIRRLHALIFIASRREFQF